MLSVSSSLLLLPAGSLCGWRVVASLSSHWGIWGGLQFGATPTKGNESISMLDHTGLGLLTEEWDHEVTCPG